MNDLDKIALVESKTLLSSLRGVTVLGDWEPTSSGDAWILPISLELLGTTPSVLMPRLTNWSVVVDFNEDSWGKVQIHPSLGQGGISSTFEHQQYNGGKHAVWSVRNGHICSLSEVHGLASSRNAVEPEPTFTVDRIIWHVCRALEWIVAAASGELVLPGDYFELPDFNVGLMENKRLLPLGAISYLEDNASFVEWQKSNSYAGLATYSMLNNVAVLRQFKDTRGVKVIYEPIWGTYIGNLKKDHTAIWLRLDEVPVVNHWQVPSTIEELAIIVSKTGTSLYELLAPALSKLSGNEDVLLFVGMPIPLKVGEEPFRYHWQALLLMPPTKKLTIKARASLIGNRLRSNSSIQWIGRGENWHPDDLQSRGRLDTPLRMAKVLLFGCGALGANLAEYLVRMGVSHLTVVDSESFEAGNLVRHPLDITYLHTHKAIALAERLNRSNPVAQVLGLPVSATSKDEALVNAIREATLIIDATANDVVLRSIPLNGMRGEVPFISISLGINARRLFFYADLCSSFSLSAFNNWFQEYREEEHQLAFRQELPRGIGCWHPLTPAPLNRIAGLAGSAVELIEQVCRGLTSFPTMHCYNLQLPEISNYEVEGTR